MNAQDLRHLLNSYRINDLLRLIVVFCPVAAAVVAYRKKRSALLWMLGIFLLPILAPALLIPFGLRGSYGVYDSLIRLLAGPAGLAYLGNRPALATERLHGGRDLALAIAFFVVLLATFVTLAILFFPAQH